MIRAVMLLAAAAVSLSCGMAPDRAWTVTPPALAKGEEPEPADNSYCYVCHVDFQEEKLNAVHGKAGVGCETCHGLSDRHSADEDNLTPPDIMWPKRRITSRCLTCHRSERLLASEKAADAHESVLDAGRRRYCTECHGKEHRPKHRTRVWDKETGRLLRRTGGPAMDRR